MNQYFNSPVKDNYRTLSPSLTKRSNDVRSLSPGRARPVSKNYMRPISQLRSPPSGPYDSSSANQGDVMTSKSMRE